MVSQCKYERRIPNVGHAAILSPYPGVSFADRKGTLKNETRRNRVMMNSQVSIAGQNRAAVGIWFDTRCSDR
jgi:hypothetical protein